MATTSFAFNLSHADDAGFNAWAKQVSTSLAQSGLIQTADTGQTAFGSPLITKPGANLDAGYQIWRFNDAMHTGSPSFPIYLKFQFGTGVTVSTDAALDCQAGTSTDGAGTLTGSTSDVFEFESTDTPSAPNSAPCFLTHSDGFFGLFFGLGGVSTSTEPHMGWFSGLVSRSFSADGTANGDSFFITSQMDQISTIQSMEQRGPHQSVDYATGTTYGTILPGAGIQGAWGLLPGGDNFNSYLDADGNTAVFPAFGAAPHPFPMNSVVFGWASDLARYTTFTATPIGTTERTYLTLDGRVLGGAGPCAISEVEASKYIMGVAWE